MSVVQAREGSPLQLPERSQRADCLALCFRRRLALSSCPVTLRYPYEVRKESEYFDDIPDEKSEGHARSGFAHR